MPAEALDAALREHRPLVERIASAMLGRLPANVERDDLVQVGMIAVWRVLPRFDPAHGASVQTFLGHAIRGAMLSHLRAEDWAGVADRRDLRAIAAARRQLEQRQGRAPRAAEVASEAGLAPATVNRLAAAGPVPQSELDAETLAADGADPLDVLLELELQAALVDALAALPERWRAAVVRDEGTDAEVGAVLGMSAWSVSHARRQAAAAVRERLALAAPARRIRRPPSELGYTGRGSTPLAAGGVSRASSRSR